MITETPISSEMFKQSMRLLAGGVCIVATNSNGEWHGLTMTAVCSLTMDPPSLIACVNRDAGAHGIMSATRRVSVNVLTHDHMDLAELFSSSRVKGPERFDEKRWTGMASGVPALDRCTHRSRLRSHSGDRGRAAFRVFLRSEKRPASAGQETARSFQSRVLRCSAGLLIAIAAQAATSDFDPEQESARRS